MARYFPNVGQKDDELNSEYLSAKATDNHALPESPGEQIPAESRAMLIAEPCSDQQWAAGRTVRDI